MTAFPRILLEAVVFVTMILIALGALAYGWKKWLGELRKRELPMWRRTAPSAGFLAVTAQATLFLAIWIWPHIGRDYVSFGEWARSELLLFLIAFPLVLAGQGPSRWWLLLSSVLLFIICFFIALTA